MTDVVIGLDLGATKMLGVLVDRRATVLARIQEATPVGSNGVVRDAVLRILRKIIEVSRASGGSPMGIAIGAPGYIHPKTGVIVDATNLGVRHLPLGEIIAEQFGLRTLVLHDVKAAALGEARFGAGVGARNLAFLNVGTGIAAGLILDGQLYYGAEGRAGEIGHVIMKRGGPACACGRFGCLEALAAGPAIVRRAKAAIAQHWVTTIPDLAGGVVHQITPVTVAEAARNGDGLALALIDETADYLGLAIAAMLNVLDLERLIVGGGLSQMGDLLLNPIREAVIKYALPEYRGTVPILPPQLGADAGAVGAAAALMEEV